MRSSFIILAIVMFSMSIFSCSTSDFSEEIPLEEMATEGEEGEILPNEDDD